MNSENLFIVSAVLVHCIYCMTLVHCIYDTCSLCLLEVFTLLVDGRGGTDLEWLGIVPIPSPHFGEKKERSMFLNMGNIEGIGGRESDRETSVLWGNIWRKLRKYGEREIMVAGGKCVNASGLGNLTEIAYC